MILIDRIKKDYLNARKTRAPQAAVLGTLIGTIETKEKTLPAGSQLDELAVIATIRSFFKGIDETLNAAASGKLDAARAAEVTATARMERATLEAYLPQQMSEADLEAFITPLALAKEPKGKIMGALKAQHAGLYDGKLAAAVIDRLLAA